MTMQMFPVSPHLQTSICCLRVAPTMKLQQPTSSGRDVPRQGPSHLSGASAHLQPAWHCTSRETSPAQRLGEAWLPHSMT